MSPRGSANGPRRILFSVVFHETIIQQIISDLTTINLGLFVKYYPADLT
jgi:hypothetical protein